MGWWEQGRDGSSFTRTSEDDSSLLMWGDGPADLVDGLLYDLKIEFLRDLGRMPSKQEIIAGLKFSTRVLDDLAEEPKLAPSVTRAQHQVINQFGYVATGGDVVATQRQIDAQKLVRAVLNALSVEPRDQSDDEPLPVWVTLCMRHGVEYRDEHGSQESALSFLASGLENGYLSPKVVISPDGEEITRPELMGVLADLIHQSEI